VAENEEKMKPEDNILKQLKEQNIEFNSPKSMSGERTHTST